MTGIDHEHSETVLEAARWYAQKGAIERQQRPAVPLLQEHFGLTPKEACEAIAEAALIRARAL